MDSSPNVVSTPSKSRQLLVGAKKQLNYIQDQGSVFVCRQPLSKISKVQV